MEIDDNEEEAIARHMAHGSKLLWVEDPVLREVRHAAWREKQLAEYRVKRAARIAELGLGSHRKEP